jgi:L-glutamine-phosphate cytidylyltransferase
MRAIVLAAGKGSRLNPFTKEEPKCMLSVGGESIIQRLIRIMRSEGIDDIVVVVGYHKELLKAHLPEGVRFLDYADYETTNNFHTLWSVRDELDCSFLCIFADVLIQPGALRRLLMCPQDISLMVDTRQRLEDTMRVKIQSGCVESVGSHIEPDAADGNFVGISKFSKVGAKMLVNQMRIMAGSHFQDYYTIAVDQLAKQAMLVGYADIGDMPWAEVDTLNDWEKAKELFAS